VFNTLLSAALPLLACYLGVMLKFFCFPLRSMAPAARKLKGGLRKMFKRNLAEESEDPVAFTLSDDEDDTDDEADPPRQGPPSEAKHSRDSPQDSHVSHEGPDLHRSELVSCSSCQGHALEASSVSQATVTPMTLSGTVCVPEHIAEAVGPALPTKTRSTSEPALFANRVMESEDGQEQGGDSLMGHEPTAKIGQLEPEVVITLNRFNDKLPRELQLAVLKALVEVHEEEHQRAVRGECSEHVWSVRAAGKTRWVGRDKGLRELVKFTRVGYYNYLLFRNDSMFPCRCPKHGSLSRSMASCGTRCT
jgi:hypothetical protein